jgi:hypothetical protein
MRVREVSITGNSNDVLAPQPVSLSRGMNVKMNATMEMRLL